MVRAAGTREAIERLRGIIEPDSYKQQLEQAKKQLISRAEQLLIDRELTEGDPVMDTPEHLEEKLRLLETIDQSLVSIDWRISDIDEALESFKIGKEAAMNRQQRRKLAKANKD